MVREVMTGGSNMGVRITNWEVRLQAFFGRLGPPTFPFENQVVLLGVLQ